VSLSERLAPGPNALADLSQNACVHKIRYYPMNSVSRNIEQLRQGFDGHCLMDILHNVINHQTDHLFAPMLIATIDRHRDLRGKRDTARRGSRALLINMLDLNPRLVASPIIVELRK
jgi:hypothetical protein